MQAARRLQLEEARQRNGMDYKQEQGSEEMVENTSKNLLIGRPRKSTWIVLAAADFWRAHRKRKIVITCSWIESKEEHATTFWSCIHVRTKRALEGIYF